MTTLIWLLLFALIGAVVVVVCKKIVESFINLRIILKKNNTLDVTKQRHGVVLNKNKKKLEADQTIILPF